MKELDVRGLSCPQPVMMVKEELEASKEEFKVLASEAHTVKNIIKACEPFGRKVEVVENGLEYILNVK